VSMIFEGIGPLFKNKGKPHDALPSFIPINL
jgi:hypothetical protein